jgi:hypothetical protein
MWNNFILYIALFLPISLFSQSKKEQINTLQKSVDNLINLLILQQKDNFENDSIIKVLNNKINDLVKLNETYKGLLSSYKVSNIDTTGDDDFFGNGYDSPYNSEIEENPIEFVKAKKIDDVTIDTNTNSVNTILADYTLEPTDWEKYYNGKTMYSFSEKNSDNRIEKVCVWPNVYWIKVEKECEVFLFVNVNELGHIVDISEIPELTTTSDKKILNDVLAVVRDQAKYCPIIINSITNDTRNKNGVYRFCFKVKLVPTD